MTPTVAPLPWHSIAVWAIALVSIALVLARPWHWPEAIWSACGAVALVAAGLVPVPQAIAAVAKGLDVYLFLFGMMLVAELARRQGVFDWAAVHAVNAARGARARLFWLIYFVGIVVTVLLSNDATAVVLTPAVQASVRAANAEPLPFLLICAFIANAASFVLPISNPANLVVYGKHLPHLAVWLKTFALASFISIAVTCLVLRWLSRKMLSGPMSSRLPSGKLSGPGRLTLAGVAVLAAVLLIVSARGEDLGFPACLTAVLIVLAVTARDTAAPKAILKEISWSVFPLVAGLFVLVQGMNQAGALPAAISALQAVARLQPWLGVLLTGFGTALVSNLMNNLPSGLIAGAAVQTAGVHGLLRDAVLIGVDLGPNLSVSGSLATILWLLAIRREGQRIGFFQFLRFGALVMPPALALAVLALLVYHS